MDGNFLERIWGKVVDKLGAIATFIPSIAEKIKVDIAERDAEKIRAHATELREAGLKQVEFADQMLEAVSDGNLDLVEGSKLATGLEKLVDEWEDVFTGVDEDDPPTTSTADRSNE